MKTLMKTLLLGGLLLSTTASVYAEGPRAQLKALVDQLQQTPNDQSLREQIIKLKLTLDPPPAIPEEARGHFVKAVALQKAVTDVKDYDLVISEYKQALLLAPWWGDAYFNLSIAQEASNQIDDAVSTLKLYLLTHPAETEARTGQDKLYALEAKQEKIDAQQKEKTSAEENAQAHKAMAAIVLANLKKAVNGADYERWMGCESSPYSGTPCNGVNEQERANHFWGWPPGVANERYIFYDDHVEICFLGNGGVSCDYGAITGTPNGMFINDMVWETVPSPGDASPKKQIWALVNENNGEIEFSYDRPVDPTSFNPNTLYQYTWYKRH